MCGWLACYSLIQRPGLPRLRPHRALPLQLLLSRACASSLMTAARQLIAAFLRRGIERRITLLFMADAPEPSLGVRIGKVGYAVVADALRETDRLGPIVGSRRLAVRGRAASRQQHESDEQTHHAPRAEPCHGSSEYLRASGHR